MGRSIHNWLLNLGPEYGVDPVVFGVIYVGATPLFVLCVAWLLRNVKQRRPIVWPVVLGTLFFISSYLYIFVAGKNIPWWAYLVVVAFLFCAGGLTLKTIRKKVAEEIAEDRFFSKRP